MTDLDTGVDFVDGLTAYAADVNARFNAIEAFVNTTGIPKAQARVLTGAMMALRTVVAENLDPVTNGAYNVRAYGAVGDGVADDTAAIAAALAAAATGSGGYRAVYMPAGIYRITEQLALAANVTLIGAGSRPGNQGGTAIAYDGPDATDWIKCGAPGTDWSNSSIQGVRIVPDATYVGTSGYAVRVYNPTNQSVIDDVLVSGAPSGQIFIDNDTGGAGNPGANFFCLRNFFVIGGLVPLKIRGGRQYMLVENGGIDTGATTTQCCVVSSGEGRAFTLTFIGVKAECDTGHNVVGFRVTSEAPVTFIGCTVYHNTTTDTATAFQVQIGSKRNQVHMIGCSSLGTTALFEDLDNGATIAGSAAGSMASQVMNTRGLVVIPYDEDSAADYSRSMIFHQACRIAFMTSAGAAGTTASTIHSGDGSPEAAVTAAIGSVYLQQNGTVGSAAWVKESGSGNTGWVRLSRRKAVSAVKTSAYTVVLATDEVVLCDPTGGAFTVTLPATHVAGDTATIKNASASANVITIDPADADTIDGAATATVTTARGITTMVSDGTNWHTI